MNRSELATEFNIYPWDVDDWLLWGCPAKRVRTLWEFDLERVRNWLEIKKIRVHRVRRSHSYKKPLFDMGWFGDRCPICIERGFAGESAGRVYTMGEVLEGEWHLRRTGIPCGHSIFLPPRRILRASAGKGRLDESRKGEWPALRITSCDRGEEMAYIRVIYRTKKNHFDYVPSDLLDRLINKDEITHFYRPSEKKWVDVKCDLIRATGESHQGPRRRRTDTLTDRKTRN